MFCGNLLHANKLLQVFREWYGGLLPQKVGTLLCMQPPVLATNSEVICKCLKLFDMILFAAYSEVICEF